jgi:LexA-binding, inner membrane-associated putative hydrolase
MGLAALIVYVTLGRRRIDYRYVLVGAVAPDLVDAALGLVWFDGPGGRWIGHSLLAVIAISIAVVIAFSGERRLAVFGLAVGWLLHLAGDGMWNTPRTFLWPAFGTAFARGAASPYSIEVFLHPLDHLVTWGKELFGLAVLLWFVVAFRLHDKERLRLFLRDGYLRP